MAEFASPQETQRALEILLDLQSEDPNRLDGILHKYANPFTSWPLLAEPTRAFLSFFETPVPAIETNGVQQNINPKIKELVEEFDREYAAAKEQHVNAETASRKFVDALKEQAKKSNTALPETQAPIPLETEGAPVSPERVQQIVSSAVQYPGPPEEKALVFHALTLFASEQPAQSITNLIPRAIAVTQASRVLVSPEEVIPKEALFSPRAAGVFQQLDTVVNHPERISKNTFGEMTARWGENFVNSAWFTRLRTDANQMIADQKGTAKIMGKVSSLFSDISTTVFRGPIDQHVITYIETYRMVAAGGVPMTSAPQFGSVALGYGGQLVRMGGSYVIRAGVKAGLKKAAISGATKFGLEAVAGVATGGLGWAAAAATSALGWLKDKGVGLFKILVGMGTSSAPKDKLLLVVGAGIVLVFFLPIFPLLNLPAFNQSMIDTSLATVGTSGGMSNDSPIPAPSFGPINGSITDCITSQGTNIEGTQTLTLSADRASRIQDVSQKYPQLGCYSQVLNCPTTKINITAFAVQSGGLGGYAPSGAPGNIIFYPAFFAYDDYYFARTLAHEMMHEIQWFHSNVFDAFINGTTDGSFSKGYCGPLGTYKAGNENPYETMAEAAGLYMVGNPLLQQKCQPAYNFMRTLFSQCQK